ALDPVRFAHEDREDDSDQRREDERGDRDLRGRFHRDEDLVEVLPVEEALLEDLVRRWQQEALFLAQPLVAHEVPDTDGAGHDDQRRYYATRDPPCQAALGLDRYLDSLDVPGTLALAAAHRDASRSASDTCCEIALNFGSYRRSGDRGYSNG